MASAATTTRMQNRLAIELGKEMWGDEGLRRQEQDEDVDGAGQLQHGGEGDTDAEQGPAVAPPRLRPTARLFDGYSATLARRWSEELTRERLGADGKRNDAGGDNRQRHAG